VALPWLVLSAHGGAILLGIVLACYGVPRTVLIPVGGVLADKLGPRTVMLTADVVRCVTVAGLAVLAARHVTSLAALGPIAALIGAGEVAGTLGAARTGGLRAPAMFASAVLLAESVCIALVPYLGGEAGAAVFLCLSGVCNGLGNVIFLTVMQKRVPPGLLGRVMGVLMLCAFGTFPLSVAVSGLLVRHLGPVPFFPLAGALVAVAMLFGLTQREFRTFGAVAVDAAVAHATAKAAEGSRK
jgi:hypothetical protein